MGLSERHEGGPPAPVRRQSIIGTWLTSLPEDERAAAVAMLDDPRWTNPRLHAAFTAEGCPALSVAAVSLYRREHRGTR